MFEAPGSAPEAAFHSIVVAGFLLTFGYLVADLMVGKRLDGLTTWGLSFVGLVAFSLVLTGWHVLSGGGVFSDPQLVRWVMAIAFVVLLGRRMVARGGRPEFDRRAAGLAVLLAIAGIAIWCYPMFTILPVHEGGDTVLHAGYTNQLLNGETLPTAAVTGEVPNFYPWMTHSVMALAADLTPGGTAHHALGPIQVLQVVAALVALVALGMRMAGHVAAGFAGLLAALCGGLGFVMLRGIDVVLDPRLYGERYLGDLLIKRSYNLSLFNLPPAWPRDVAFTLLICFLLALVAGAQLRHGRPLLVAGIALGLAGLTGAESFFVGLGALLLFTIVPLGISRSALAVCTLLPALGLYLLWIVPQAAAWRDLGGYVNLTSVEPVTLSPLAIVVSWGAVAALAPFGLWLIWSRWREDVTVRVVGCLVVSAAFGVVAASFLPDLLGPSFEALGRAQRYWPLLYLGLALSGARVMSTFLARSRGPRRRWAWGAAVSVVFVALPSPVVASLAYPEKVFISERVSKAVRGDESALYNLLAASGRRCTAAVPDAITLKTWAYTGDRVVLAVWGAQIGHGNLARIRWADIYERIPGDEERLAANRILTTGNATEAEWATVARRFDVSVVVAPKRAADAPVFRAYERLELSDPRYVAFRLKPCRAD